MRASLIIFLVLFTSLAHAEMIKIPWKGDYVHNSSRTWSRDNPNDSGFSRNFLNGAPEEGGKVQKDGELWIETVLPENTTGPIPFMLVLHGCNGISSLTSLWAHHVARVLNAEGVGVLILDSYTTRLVNSSCGIPDFHWGRRRADDAYSALNYLVDQKLAKPDDVYIMGQSNGGLATLVALTQKVNDHKYQFAAGFPVVPSCINLSTKSADYYHPLIVFAGEKDDANDPKHCIEMLKKKRATPIQLIVYKDADHGFMVDYQTRVIKGWTDRNGKAHDWNLSHNPGAEKDMMRTIISAVKTKKFSTGIEFR